MEKKPKLKTMIKDRLEQIAAPKSRSDMLEKISRNINRPIIGNMLCLEKSSNENMSRIQKALERANKIDVLGQRSLSSGGGHIFRQVLSPVTKLQKYEFSRARLPKPREIVHPDWDERFIHSQPLDVEERRAVAPPAVFDEVIGEFRLSSRNGKRSPSDIDSLSSSLDGRPATSPSGVFTRKEEGKSRKKEFLYTTYLFHPKKQEDGIVGNTIDGLANQILEVGAEDDAVVERYSIDVGLRQPSDWAQSDKQSFEQKIGLIWNDIVSEFRKTGASISQQDLVEVSNFREPSSKLQAIVGCFSILFGLPAPPSWLSAQRTFFRELSSFRKFLQEMDPFHLPLTLLRSVVAYKEAGVAKWQSGASVGLCPVGVKLLRWLQTFSILAKVIIAVHDNRPSTSVTSLYFEFRYSKRIVELSGVETSDQKMTLFFGEISKLGNWEPRMFEFWDRYDYVHSARMLEAVEEDDDTSGDEGEDSFSLNYEDMTAECVRRDVRAVLTKIHEKASGTARLASKMSLKSLKSSKGVKKLLPVSLPGVVKATLRDDSYVSDR